jgi:hypothetical protein
MIVPLHLYWTKGVENLLVKGLSVCSTVPIQIDVIITKHLIARKRAVFNILSSLSNLPFSTIDEK